MSFLEVLRRNRAFELLMGRPVRCDTYGAGREFRKFETGLKDPDPNAPIIEEFTINFSTGEIRGKSEEK